MAQTSWPFENIDTTETQFSQWARNINEGIRQGSGSELVVGAPGGAMTVTVGTGQAMIRGHYYSSDAVETLTIAAADGSNPRIDSVVLELNPTANTVIVKVLTGTPAGSPTAPSLTQTESGIYQIRLANVLVGTGVLQIVSGNITDLRTYMFAGVGKWTTATRPTNPVANQTTGFNTTIGAHEFWNGSSWVFFGGITTAGDLIIGGAGGVPTRLAAGSNGSLLRIDSGSPSYLPVGTNGQILSSNGTAPVWTNNTSIPNTLIDAAGDLIIGTADNTVGRLAIGANGRVLTSNGTTASWQPAPSPSETWTLITSGNFPSTAMSQTFSGLGGYQNYIILFHARTNADSHVISVALNGTSDAALNGLDISNQSSTVTGIRRAQNVSLGSLWTQNFQTMGYATITLRGAGGTTPAECNVVCSTEPGSTSTSKVLSGWANKDSNPLTSITISAVNGSQLTGNMRIWGSN